MRPPPPPRSPEPPSSTPTTPARHAPTPPPPSPKPPMTRSHRPPPAVHSPSPSPRLPKPPMTRSDRPPPPPRHPPPPPSAPPPRPHHPPLQPPPPSRPNHPPPLPEPAFSHYPPYYSMPPPLKRRRSGCSGCASCMLAFTFLLLLSIIAIIACFLLFRPQDPKIAVNSVRFPAFSLSNGTIDFTFFQYVAVRNPNRYSFSHYDSSLQLFYSGAQLGFMFIPAGHIAPGQTQYVSATFNVRSIPVANQLSATSAVALSSGVGPTLEVETRMKMAGRVRVLKLLAHHVQSSARCRVTMEVSNGNVLGFHC